jgi:hypothetical protein
LGLLLGFGQGGQKQRRQNSDNGDHHQQFDQRETRLGSSAAFFGPLAAPGCPKGTLIYNSHNSLYAVEVLNRHDAKQLSYDIQHKSSL